ncbi:MAG: glycosyltransferase family 39 protein [Bacteroidota bacterium]
MADKTIRTLYFLAAVILLLPSLFFPISHDLSIFLLGAETIAEGGKIYVDYIDLKPPAVYYFFTIPYMIFGDSEMGIRIFGFLWQLLTVGTMFYVISKRTGKIVAAGISIILYSMYLSGTNYYNTLQIETLAGLPVLWILYLLSGEINNRRLLISSLLAGALTAFKPTFGLILILIIIISIYHKRDFKKILSYMLFFAAPVILSLLPLLDPEIRNGFFEVLSFLKAYAGGDESLAGFIKGLIKFTSEYLGNNLSFAVIIPAFFILIKSKEDRRLISVSYLLFFFLFLSMLWEGKYFAYHYARFLIPLFLLSGLGIDYLFRHGYLRLKGKDFYSKLIIITLAVLFIIFSPLPRWLRVAPLSYLYFKSEESYNSYLHNDRLPGFRRYEHYQAGNFIKKHKNKGDTLVVSGIGSSSIYQIADVDNTSAFASSAFYFSKLAPDIWYNKYINEVKNADWLIIQRNDPDHFFMKHDLTTMESFLANEELNKILDSRYSKVFETEIMIVYRAND